MTKSFAITNNVTKMIAVFTAVVVAVALIAATTASAHRGGGYPNYFGVDKPTSKSVCYGGKWETKMKWNKHWKWSWGNDWGWYKRQKVWVPSYEQLGFSSFDQCIRFVSTPQPETKADCKKNGWYRLGFSSRGDCNRYVVLNGGGGYSGLREDEA